MYFIGFICISWMFLKLKSYISHQILISNYRLNPNLMKKIILLYFFLLCATYSIVSQTTNLQKAQSYIASKSEVCIRFKANNAIQFQEIASTLPIGHRVNKNTFEGEVYVNAETLPLFLAYGVTYTVEAEDNEFYPHGNPAYGQSQYITPAAAAWDDDWNAYPTYTEYVAKMN